MGVGGRIHVDFKPYFARARYYNITILQYYNITILQYLMSRSPLFGQLPSADGHLSSYVALL